MHRLAPFLFLSLWTACAQEPGFDFAMVQQGELTVRVSDADGQPLSGAIVGLRMVPEDGRWAWIVRSPTTADGQAVLRFTAPLGYGEPTLVTWHADYAMHRQALDLDPRHNQEIRPIQLEPRAAK
jgi:hypothetical protein